MPSSPPCRPGQRHSRLINNICRAALLLGATENKQILDETDLKRVLFDLQQQPA
jgi:hypothetical protein